jgi:excisionase family DNA binding protein
MTDTLTITETCNLLGVRPGTVSALINQKRLDVQRLKGTNRKLIIVNEKLEAEKAYVKLSSREKVELAKRRIVCPPAPCASAP